MKSEIKKKNGEEREGREARKERRRGHSHSHLYFLLKDGALVLCAKRKQTKITKIREQEHCESIHLIPHSRPPSLPVSLTLAYSHSHSLSHNQKEQPQ